MSRDTYYGGVVIVGGLTALVGWGYAVASYGILLGLGLGWIPALFVGLIAGFAWPVIVGLAVLGAVLLLAAG